MEKNTQGNQMPKYEHRYLEHSIQSRGWVPPVEFTSGWKGNLEQALQMHSIQTRRAVASSVGHDK